MDPYVVLLGCLPRNSVQSEFTMPCLHTRSVADGYESDGAPGKDLGTAGSTWLAGGDSWLLLWCFESLLSTVDMTTPFTLAVAEACLVSYCT